MQAGKEKPASKSKLSSQSSTLVNVAALCGSFGACLLALLCKQTGLSAFLLFVFVICGISRLWGARSLTSVSIGLNAPSARVFAGESVEISYTVRNGKFLPLIWLELAQRLPRDGCMAPADSDDLYDLPLPEEEREALHQEYARLLEEENKKDHPGHVPEPVDTFHAFKKKFAFILWYQSLEWTSSWKAVKRGVYRVEEVLLRSGDGFGLTQSERYCPVEQQPVFTVYPKIVPVRADPFLNNLWDAKSGAKGYFEDCTIIRGERPYQFSDSWKRINWRMAARREELEVKLYETILPKSMHFILDGASFLKLSPENDELEDAISVLASLILRLCDAQVWCGLSLPRTSTQPPVNLFPGDGDADDLLFCLSGFHCGDKVSPVDGTELVRSKDRAGQIYLLTYDASDGRNKELLDQLGTYGVSLISYRDDFSGSVACADFLDYKILSLPALKGGNAHGGAAGA